MQTGSHFVRIRNTATLKQCNREPAENSFISEF